MDWPKYDELPPLAAVMLRVPAKRAVSGESMSGRSALGHVTCRRVQDPRQGNGEGGLGARKGRKREKEREREREREKERERD